MDKQRQAEGSKVEEGKPEGGEAVCDSIVRNYSIV